MINPNSDSQGWRAMSTRAYTRQFTLPMLGYHHRIEDRQASFVTSKPPSSKVFWSGQGGGEGRVMPSAIERGGGVKPAESRPTRVGSLPSLMGLAQTSEQVSDRPGTGPLRAR